MSAKTSYTYIFLLLMVTLLVSGCNSKPKLNKHTLKHEHIVTSFWSENESKIIAFYKLYSTYNKIWTREINEGNNPMLENLDKERLVTEKQRKNIKEIMEELGVLEVYLHMGAKEGRTYMYHFSKTNSRAEKKMFENTDAGYSYGYVSDEQSPAIYLNAYPYRNKKYDPKKIRMRLFDKDGEMTLFMPL